MKLALVVHSMRDEARRVADELTGHAVGLGMEVVEAEDGMEGVDVVVAIGGDGTVLRAARLAWQADVPVLGVNVGHIAYLAAADPADAARALDVLAAGEHRESTRMTVAASWPGGRDAGLNDVVVEKVVSGHAVQISLDVDGRHFANYRTDGLVFATPTGSTAYAFSAGGPMVDPELAGLVVTPVAAHNFFAPTLVLAATTVLTCRGSGGRPVRVNIDGREVAVLGPGVPVEIRRGDRPVRFVVPWDRPFDQVVREKFGLDGA